MMISTSIGARCLRNLGNGAVKKHIKNQVPGKLSKHDKAMAALKIAGSSSEAADVQVKNKIKA